MFWKVSGLLFIDIVYLEFLRGSVAFKLSEDVFVWIFRIICFSVRNPAFYDWCEMFIVVQHLMSNMNWKKEKPMLYTMIAKMT